MSSNNRVTTFLSKEDTKLFNLAVKKYGLKDAELAREILHSWLFNNKLHLLKTKG